MLPGGGGTQLPAAGAGAQRGRPQSPLIPRPGGIGRLGCVLQARRGHLTLTDTPPRPPHFSEPPFPHLQCKGTDPCLNRCCEAKARNRGRAAGLTSRALQANPPGGAPVLVGLARGLAHGEGAVPLGERTSGRS